MPSRIKSLRESAFKQQAGRCFYCHEAMWLLSPAELRRPAPSARAAAFLRCTAEHLQPKSCGGKDTATNIAAACGRCNATRHKRRKPPEPASYRASVLRRMAAGRWHDRWVHGIPATTVRLG